MRALESRRMKSRSHFAAKRIPLSKDFVLSVAVPIATTALHDILPDWRFQTVIMCSEKVELKILDSVTLRGNLYPAMTRGSAIILGVGVSLHKWTHLTEDYSDALTFLSTYNAVDPNQIGFWGMSFNEPMVLAAAALDPRARFLLLVVPEEGSHVFGVPDSEGRKTYKLIQGTMPTAFRYRNHVTFVKWELKGPKKLHLANGPDTNKRQKLQVDSIRGAVSGKSVRYYSIRHTDV
ncbi:uncharacterized protein BO96DRAFT_436686 [Aspergillus niger CBS 101883]|uniref:uncharacterized protein n=1 Tax=Aspergillus lacticoffeatus (strain CBS 101883) TaxID=1450533 RepID=UPI000D8027DF|nr:uncharacterized protein BO96DRAFT_436686 [Aspergillus niger CBS 101883]PYH53774.1 hypothetical protein BO96DRAFT_436686 [Aspergillus niger CBS 101883]